jgi:hypothetical protein
MKLDTELTLAHWMFTLIEQHSPKDIAQSVPVDYLDGCTFFPDKFGKVSHKHVCIEHDIDYWTKRTVLDKIISDFKWLININKAHKSNTVIWRPTILLLTSLAYIALSTFGWYFWLRRHKWKSPN